MGVVVDVAGAKAGAAVTDQALVAVVATAPPQVARWQAPRADESFSRPFKFVRIQSIDTDQVAVLSDIADVEYATNRHRLIHDDLHPFVAHPDVDPLGNFRRNPEAAQTLVPEQQKLGRQLAFIF